MCGGWLLRCVTVTTLPCSTFLQGLRQEPELPLVLPEQPVPSVQRPPALHSSPSAAGLGPRLSSLSASQREQQALQDLVDLAEEGLGASPRPHSGVAGEALGGVLGQPYPV